jgi:hypothetical protein
MRQGGGEPQRGSWKQNPGKVLVAKESQEVPKNRKNLEVK